jgi:D-alanine-D-alanine ligase
MDISLVFNMKRDSISLNKDESPSSAGHRSVVVSETEDNKSTKNYNDLYAEWDDEETILAVKDALEEHHKVSLVEADDKAYEQLIKSKPEFVFNIAEGIGGSCREAVMPSIYELLNLHYTGSDPLTLAICLNKARTKEILSYYQIPNSNFFIVNSSHDTRLNSLSFPLIVKPIHEGSSKGIYNSSFVNNELELNQEIDRVISLYHQPALVEEFLPGREFTVAMLGNGKDLRILPIVEFDLELLPTEANKIYSYEAKWIWDTVEEKLTGIHICPANLEDNLKKNIEKVCTETYNVLNCRDWCRIDIRLDKNNIPNVMELNPLPGIIPNPDAHSCFPAAARAAGLSYSQLINSVLNVAIDRYKK